MRIGLVLGALALAGVTLVAATPRPVQDAEAMAAQDGAPDGAAMMARMMKAMTPGEQHAGLAQLVGEWDLEVQIAMAPGMPMMTTKATSEIEAVLGGRYIIEEVAGDMMGQPFKGISITGFDNLSGTFDNIWMDNQSTAMTFMKGTGEADGSITWRGERDDPMMGKVSTHGAQRWTDAGLVFESWDTIGGKEHKAMVITYTRKGAAPAR